MTAMWTNIKTNQVALTIFILAFGVIRTQLALLTAIVVALATAYGAIMILHSSPRPGAPGPSPFPILGSLHLMNGYRVSYVYQFLHNIKIGLYYRHSYLEYEITIQMKSAIF